MKVKLDKQKIFFGSLLTGSLNRREGLYRAWLMAIQGRTAGEARAMADSWPAFWFHTVGAHSDARPDARLTQGLTQGSRKAHARPGRDKLQPIFIQRAAILQFSLLYIKQLTNILSIISRQLLYPVYYRARFYTIFAAV